MITHINYANNCFFESQKENSKSAILNGCDFSITYNIDSLDSDFKEKTQHILNEKRGAGFWVWKPQIIKQTLNEIDFGDYIFYKGNV